MKQPIIGFIGAGNMASSLIGGLIANHYPEDKIWVANPTQDQLDSLLDCFKKIHVTLDNRKAAQESDVLVLAVKPNVLKSVILELKDILSTEKPLIITVVAGVTSETIMKWAQCSDLSIVRCMPNIPALLGCGTTGLCANSYVSEEQAGTAETILRAVGLTLWIKNEEDLNAVTAISGSGPAYFFLVMEAMLNCAQTMGLSKEQAELLTVNTALGAARMALECEKDLKALRQQVTSAGGTTEKAIQVLEAGGIRDLFSKALYAARDRAAEISKSIE